MMQFLQELNESRLYRQVGELENRTMQSIGERLFEHMLALQILVHEEPAFAKRYAEAVMKYQDFRGFRTSMPDLYNFISLVLNQDTYSHIVEPDSGIQIPELRLRRNLRALANGRFDNRDWSELMMYLQRNMNLSSALFPLRRAIGDYTKSTDNEKRTITRRLLTQMREHGRQSDLYVRLQKHA